MKLDANIRALLDNESFEDIENAWMSRLDTAPDELEFFLPVVRALLQRGHPERAELLVQLWIEAQRERGDAEAEWNTVTALLGVWSDADIVRAALMQALQRRHAGKPSLLQLVDHFGLERSSEPRTVLNRVETWLRYDVGQPVHMPTRGVGRVFELNLALETLRVEFPDGRKESVRIGEAAHLLEALPPDHFLVQKLENVSELQAQAESDPGELLRRIFESLGSPLAVSDLRSCVDGIVARNSWTAWWKRAREDPRLTVGSGNRPRCTWSDSASEAESRLLEEFEDADPEQQLQLARKHAGRSRALGEAMARGLRAAFATRQGSDSGLALEILLTLDALGHGAGRDADTAAFLQRDDVAALIASVRERRVRERAIELVHSQREDWQDVLLELLETETDARTTTSIYETLRLAPDPRPLERGIVQVLSQPSRAPRLYAWLCREMAKRPELEERADWRFLRGLIEACSDPALRSQRTTLRELFDPGGLAYRILPRLDPGQAEQLLRILEREGDLDEHRRDDLTSAVWSQFPALRPAGEEPLYATAEALERKRGEFEQLVRVDIPRNTEEIRKAAAHGDLRENFEYKSARERQEMLSSRAKTLHEELRRARALDPDSIDPTVIRVGTRVRLQPTGDGGSPLSLTILGPWDSDPSKGVVSYLAPAVEPLLGCRVGDAVRFGEVDFSVASIEVWCR